MTERLTLDSRLWKKIGPKTANKAEVRIPKKKKKKKKK